MFEILPMPSLEICAVIVGALLLIGAFCVFALAFIRWRAADARAKAEISQQLERTFTEVRSLHETVAVMNARLEALSESRTASAKPAPLGNVPAPRGYDIAARLAKKGADAEGLIANCGLTRQEAELMVRLHGGKAANAATTEATGAQRTTRIEQSSPRTRPMQSSAASMATTQSVPVLKMPAQEARAPVGTRRRGSLVSAVG